MSAGRTPNFPLTTTSRCGGDNVPEEFKQSVDLVEVSQTGIDINTPFTEANPPDGLLGVRLEQKSTNERIVTKKYADFNGVVLSTALADPLFGIVEQVDKTIVPTAGGVISVMGTNAGSGYTLATATSPAPVGGKAAQYQVNITAGGVQTIDVIDPGSGYTVAPPITIAGDGTGATATTTIATVAFLDSFGRYLETLPINNWESLQSAKSWSNPQTSQDTFNYEIDWDQANASFPSFIRRYLYARDAYPGRQANGTAFSGVYQVQITVGGTGYTNGDAISFSGNGSGATGSVIVDANGVIQHAVIITEGTGYTACTATVTTVTGSGATLTPVLQPATCVLVKENTHEGIDTWSSRAPWRAKFLIVARFYKTLPGPARVSEVLDADGAVLTVTRTEKTSITSGETFNIGSGVWTRTEKENVPGYSYFSDEVVKARILPGPIIPELDVQRGSNIPLILAKQFVRPDVVYSAGEIIPVSINVSSVSIGASPTVTLASAPGLPVGAYVTFAGTTSTPNINGTWQIVSTPTTVTLTITPTNPVTVAQSGAAGTLTATNRLVRKIQPLHGSAIARLKIDEMVAIVDLSAYNEVTGIQKAYAYPAFLKSLTFYADSARAWVTDQRPDWSYTFGGAIGPNIREGYRGPNPGTRYRFFSIGPPTAAFTAAFKPTIIITSSGTFSIKGGGASYHTAQNDPTKISRSVSVSYRTGVIKDVLTGPSPAVTPGASGDTYTVISIPNGTGPTVQFDSPVFGVQIGDAVKFTGTNSTPNIDGIYFTVNSFPDTDKILLTAPAGAVTITSPGTTGTMTDTFNTDTAGTSRARPFLDLPVSFPAKIWNKLTITGIGTGSSPTITVSVNHYLQLGQKVRISGSNSTPSIDGTWQVVSIGSASTFTITPTASVSGSGSSGTAQVIITEITEPVKTDTAGLWYFDVYDLDVLYTSGENPP